MAGSYFGRQFIALLGQSSSFNSAFNVAQVCLTWFVFTFTNSAVAVGIVAIVESMAVIIVSLPVGAIVDRVNKGLLLTLSGIMGFLVMLILVFTSTILQFNLYIILFLSAIWGASREISRSASLSTLPDLVKPENLSGANGIFRALNSSLGSISNAVAGGIIIALGISVGFGFSAAGYLASGILAALIIFPHLSADKSNVVQHREKRQSMFEELKEGFTWLISRKGFFLMTVSATFFNFFMDMTFVFFVVYVADGLIASSLVYGFVLAAFAIGDVIGSLIPGRIDLLKYTGKINVIFFGGIVGSAVLIMGLFPNAIIAVVFSLIWGVAVGIAVNLWLTSAHNIVPPKMRGRYFALDGVLSSISPVAIAVGAFVISYMGILKDFILSGILLLICTVAFSLMRSLWTLDGNARIEA